MFYLLAGLRATKAVCEFRFCSILSIQCLYSGSNISLFLRLWFSMAKMHIFLFSVPENRRNLHFSVSENLSFLHFSVSENAKKCSFRYRKHILNDFSNSLKVGYEGRNAVKTTKKTRCALALCILFITLPLQKATNMNQTSYFRLSTLLSLRTSGTRE